MSSSRRILLIVQYIPDVPSIAFFIKKNSVITSLFVSRCLMEASTSTVGACWELLLYHRRCGLFGRTTNRISLVHEVVSRVDVEDPRLPACLSCSNPGWVSFC